MFFTNKVMHQSNFDLSIEEISKIEGQAALDLAVRNGKLSDLRFRISDYKRFYTQAVESKQIVGVPQQVARICGTCSNAHLLCSIKTIENALNLKVTNQTKILRQLLNYGLMIRDHALHLYVFVLPDLLGCDSILDFDEQDEKEHQLLHDAFSVKEAGNLLSIWAGGRSVHAPFASLGGFTQLPKEPASSLTKHLREVRPHVLRLIEIFENDSPTLEEDIVFAALDDPNFAFLEGDIITSDGQHIRSAEFHNWLHHVAIPYSQASAYKIRQTSDRSPAPNALSRTLRGSGVVRDRLNGKILMVGALARVNLRQEKLHAKTRKDVKNTLRLFPSNNIFHNNLAQAIEILHSIDNALNLLENFEVKEEKPVSIKPKAGIGTAVTEAPRGLLFHEYAINAEGKVKNAKIVVPTGLNQILIEKSLKTYLADKLTLPREKIVLEAEKLIRAFDPCISCAAHFLKVNWI